MFQALETWTVNIRSSLVFSFAEKKLEKGNSEDKIMTVGSNFLDKKQTATYPE